MHYKYTLTFIWKKNCHVSYTFNQFYEEGYLEFTVSENMSRFFLFLKYIKILFDKFLNIDVSTKVVITHFSSTIMTLTCILAVKGVSTPPLFPFLNCGLSPPFLSMPLRYNV